MSRTLRWLVWLAVMAWALLQIARTSIVTDASSFLPGPANEAQRLLVQQLRDGPSTRLLLVALRLPESAPADGGARVALAAASETLRARLSNHASVAWVSNGDAEHLERERRLLFEARYLLSPGVDESAFSEAGLKSAFQRLERDMNSAMASVIRPLAAADPTLETLRLLQSGGRSLSASATGGPWLGAHGNTALLLLETRARSHETAALHAVINDIRTQAQAVLADWPKAQPRPQVEFAGPGYFGVKAHDALSADAERLSLLAIALVAALLWWALRSTTLIGLAALPVLTGAAVGFACVGWTKGSIHGITLAFGVTLIGEAVDYAIYAYVQRSADGSHPPRFWRQIALATATSLIGFMAMALSGFLGLQQLGLFSMTGLVAAAVFTRWWLPDLMRAAPIIETPRLDRLTRMLVKLRGLRWPLLAAAVLLAGMLLARGGAVWLDSLDSLSAGSAEEVAQDARYREDLGLPDLRTMIAVRAANVDAALAGAEQIGRALDGMIQAGELTAYDSPARVLPSLATQNRRRQALPTASLLRERIQLAVADGRLNADFFEPFVEDVERTRAGMIRTQADYDGSLIAHWLKSRIVVNDDGATALLNLSGVRSSERVAAVVAAAGVEGALIIDLKHDVEVLVAGYRHRAMIAALAGGAGILGLLALRVRRRGAVIAMSMSLLVTVAITTGGVALFQGHLTVFNLVSLLLVVGVASNYTLFFSTPSNEPSERARANLSVLLAAASTFLAFAMLALSRTPVLADIGSTVAFGVLVGLVTSVAFAPAVNRS